MTGWAASLSIAIWKVKRWLARTAPGASKPVSATRWVAETGGVAEKTRTLVFHQRWNLSRRVADGLVAVAQQENPLVGFRRKQAVRGRERLGDIGGARVG